MKKKLFYKNIHSANISQVLFLSLFLVTFVVSGCVTSPIRTEDYSKSWATPLSAPGLDKFAKIDDGLYRGSQPKAEGYESLKTFNIHSVVNLRLGDQKEEALAVQAQGMQYLHIPQATTGVDEENIVKFLKFATDKQNRPVFVHCLLGVDRAGINVAVYRIVVHGWSRQDALKEMYGFGYYYGLWVELEKYINTFDPAVVARKAGLPYPPKQGQ
jgi:protein tyrosine/serine phosphatase